MILSDINPSPIEGAVEFAIYSASIVGFASWVAFLLASPLRRRERARMLIGILEAGFQQNQRPEFAFVTATNSEDPSIPKEFHDVAENIRSGVRLASALEQIPHAVPPTVTAAIRAGEELGDVRKILPVCRKSLHDAESQTRSGFNYMVIGNLILLPTIPILLIVLRVIIFPRFLEILAPYPIEPPAMLRFFENYAIDVAAVQIGIALLMWAWVIFFTRGPRVSRWLRVDGTTVVPAFSTVMTPLLDLIGHWTAPFHDRLLWRLPWWRRRMQRDFCAMLCVLLDSGMPEAKAIALAAETTTNRAVLHRARKALTDLQEGANLQTALRRFDDDGEFSWRLNNAVAQPHGFAVALAGWVEALDAKAFQLEQTASQIVSTGLVIGNGAAVGMVVAGFFGMLVALIG